MKKEKISIIAILLISVILFFAFSFFHIGKFITADEHYWVYERVPQYWQALKFKSLKRTLINDKPGITVALISGAGLLFEKNPEWHEKIINENLTEYDVTNSEHLFSIFRLPIVIFSGLFLFYLFWIIRKISNQWVALWSVIFIGLSPILLGISQIINPDSLLWIFSIAAIFSYFALLKCGEIKFAILVAVFTGLAILSKYTANILFPLYLLLLVLYFIMEYKNSLKEEVCKYFKSNLGYFGLIILGSIVTIVFFLPAIFVKPVYLYRLTLGLPGLGIFWWLIAGAFIFLVLDTWILKNFILLKIKKFFQKNYRYFQIVPFFVLIIFAVLIIGRNFYPEWQMFKMVPFDAKNIGDIKSFKYFPNFLEKIFLEFNPVVFSLTPIVLLLVFYAWMKQLSKKATEFSFYVFSLTLFILIYSIISIKADVLSTIRYSIILYPLFGFIASIGLYQLFNKFSKNLKINVLISLAVIAFSAGVLFLIKPFYFNYTSFFLPKDQIITDSWGYGGYEAAQYLNSLPNAKGLIIWSDYFGVCEFFQGKCLTDYKFDQNEYLTDYFVLTRRGKIRYMQKYPRLNLDPTSAIKALPYYSQQNPVWQLIIDNRPQNYIKIFKAE